MEFTRAVPILCWAIFGLAIAGCADPAINARNSDTPAKTEQTAKAEPSLAELGKDCVTQPVPAGFRWPRETIEAFCADEFSPYISRDDARVMIDAGDGRKLDAKYEQILSDYDSGKTPEGAARYCYETFDRGDDAVGELIERWLVQSPESPHALTARGIHRVRRGSDARGGDLLKDTPQEQIDRMSHELALAMEDLQKAIQTHPKILPAYEALIHAARMEGEHALGAAALAGALSVDPKNFYVRAAYSHLRQPRWGGSFKAMEQIAEDAQPWLEENPRLVNLRALALTHRGFDDYLDGRHEAALRQYERGLAEGPVGSEMAIAAYMADMLGKKERAIELYSQVLRFAPGDPYARGNRASLYTSVGMYEQARADLETSLARTPGDTDALRTYAHLLMKQSDYKGAAEKLEKARAADPSDLWVAQKLAWVYLYKKRSFREAEPLVAQLLAADAKNGAVWLMRADLIQNLGGPGLRDALENFVQYADPSDEEQGKALPKVKAWLTSHPAS